MGGAASFAAEAKARLGAEPTAYHAKAAATLLAFQLAIELAPGCGDGCGDGWGLGFDMSVLSG